MAITELDGITLLGNLFGTYVVYFAMGVFFQERRTTKKVEWWSYCLLYVVTNGVYLMFRIPIITIIANLVLLYGLTYNYEGTQKTRWFAIALIYVILILSNTIPVLVTGRLDLNIWSSFQVNSLWVIVASHVLSYLFVLILKKIRNANEEVPLPGSYWLGIVSIPITSIVVLLIAFSNPVHSQLPLLIQAVLILIMNFLVFYLYDNVVAVLNENASNRIIEQQAKHYKNELIITKSNNEEINQLKHDIKTIS